jgi:hypothetical protein
MRTATRVLLASVLLLQSITIAGEAKPAWPDPDAKQVEKLKKELREQLPAEFSIHQVGPWIIATDVSTEQARIYTEGTIGQCAAAIQKQVFTSKPRTQPVKVYLFKDKTSYDKYNKQLFGSEPTTPFGYFSRDKNALVMNIGTGGGTLLHEMAHAMAEIDFPDIPAWLNEGIGSLFEASAMRPGGKVVGVTNWRLTGLQKDLTNNTETHFKDLLEMKDREFYGDRSGSNYASARYLMQFLQEKGKIEAFYTRIRDKKDASALDTLRGVFDNKLTVDEIEKACYDWVKTLRFYM